MEYLIVRSGKRNSIIICNNNWVKLKVKESEQTQSEFYLCLQHMDGMFGCKEAKQMDTGMSHFWTFWPLHSNIPTCVCLYPRHDVFSLTAEYSNHGNAFSISTHVGKIYILTSLDTIIKTQTESCLRSAWGYNVWVAGKRQLEMGLILLFNNPFRKDVVKHYKELCSKCCPLKVDEFGSECIHYNVNITR